MIKTEKITKIEKSWKKEGYVFVGISGKSDTKLRKVYTYRHKAGLGYINLDTDIYSFNWDGQTGTNIQYVGNYKSVDEAVGEAVVKPAEIVVVDDDGEIRHEKYNQIKSFIENDIPVFLVGPAGSGKNHTLEQIAWDLGMEFYFTNSIQQEYKLTGFIDAGGQYHETEFYKAFTNGGLFFLDEIDASIPEVLVLLNAAIANRYFEFPNGKVKANKNFRVVSAGNTMGNGADEKYTGRLTLDQATLDRFAIIEFGYSLKVELHLAKNNAELVSFIRQLREKADATGVRSTFSYRCISMVTKMEGKLALEDLMTMVVLKGLDKDTVNSLTVEGDSKYHRALKKVQR